jgi:DNA-directed RNA polymerase sigma subunit (sigma70/sigma32)
MRQDAGKRRGAYMGYQHSHSEISKMLGISRARVRQLEESALRKLKKSGVLHALARDYFGIPT